MYLSTRRWPINPIVVDDFRNQQRNYIVHFPKTNVCILVPVAEGCTRRWFWLGWVMCDGIAHACWVVFPQASTSEQSSNSQSAEATVCLETTFLGEIVACLLHPPASAHFNKCKFSRMSCSAVLLSYQIYKLQRVHWIRSDWSELEGIKWTEEESNKGPSRLW